MRKAAYGLSVVVDLWTIFPRRAALDLHWPPVVGALYQVDCKRVEAAVPGTGSARQLGQLGRHRTPVLRLIVVGDYRRLRVEGPWITDGRDETLGRINQREAGSDCAVGVAWIVS